MSFRPAAEREGHRAFLNRYYRHVRHVYDLSRRYYLFGRDRVLGEMLAEPWERLIEVGPGTGRNLRKLHRARPGARYGGLEASDVMLEHARKRCPWAKLQQGFAEEANLSSLLGRPPDRILFSYVLSMVQDAERALVRARQSLAPGGKVVVVDFGDLAGLPWLAGPLARFLRSFHVTAPPRRLLEAQGGELRWGPGRYFVVAELGAAS